MISPTSPRIWLRYVDDVFAITKKSNVDGTLQWLNSQHQNIQFTMENEKKNRIPFLDVMVERCSNQLQFDVYHSILKTIGTQLFTLWLIDSAILN
jgi:hypothetical protein